jgi:polar amino acid transport system substrate-binding protein
MRTASRLTAVLLAASITLVGCGSNSLDNSSDKKGGEVKTSVDKEAAALVPQAIKDKGTLTVGSDASYAPSEFLAGDGKTIEGFDIDLFKAVGEKLGLKVTFQNADFGSIIAGVNSDKYDVGVSSFTINAERLQAANMVSYFSAGTQWAALKGNPKNVDPQKPCGLNVAVQSNTVQQTDDLPPKAKACQSAGKPFKVDPYAKQDQATASVASGKDDAMLADSPVIAYAVKQSNGKLEAVGDIYDSAPYGYVVAKKNTDLANALAAALKALKADGTYEKVLTNWGVEQGAVDSFDVNPAVQ